MAAAIAAGMPNSGMSPEAALAAAFRPGWCAQVDSSKSSMLARNAATVRISHLICCRSRQDPVRYRTASATNEAARNTTNTAASASSVPISTGGSPGVPNGLAKVAETPPGAGVLHKSRPQDQAGGAQRGGR